MIPDFAPLRAATTSCTLLPMLETMPIPVTTTRRMILSSGLRRLKQADAKIHRGIDGLAVGFEKSVGNAEVEFPQDHALQIYDILNLPDARDHHTGELDLAYSQGPSLSGGAEPAQEKAEHLPQSIKAETT